MAVQNKIVSSTGKLESGRLLQLRNSHHRSVSALRRKLHSGGNFFAFRRDSPDSRRMGDGDARVVYGKSILTAYSKKLLKSLISGAFCLCFPAKCSVISVLLST